MGYCIAPSSHSGGHKLKPIVIYRVPCCPQIFARIVSQTHPHPTSIHICPFVRTFHLFILPFSHHPVVRSLSLSLQPQPSSYLIIDRIYLNLILRSSSYRYIPQPYVSPSPSPSLSPRTIHIHIVSISHPHMIIISFLQTKYD